MKNKSSKIFIEFLGLIVGCLFMSIGLNMFFKPFTIAPGGLSGVSVVVSKMTGLSVSTVMLTIGIPFLLSSIKILGKKDAMKTFIGMMVLSGMIRMTDPLSAIQVTEDVLLASITGAIVLGIGLGIVFSVGATTGGTDLIAFMLNRIFPGITVPKFLSIIDGIIVLSAGIANKNLETGLYSAISLYIIVKVVDAMISGFEYSKAFMIITNEAEKLRSAILEDTHRGVTILDAKGGYTNEHKNILLVVVNKKEQEVYLKNLIKSEDPNSFIIVSNVHEVFGNGFKAIKG